jgi:hypothetical protein
MASFEIISDTVDIEVIAMGKSIRDLRRPRKLFGEGRWWKMKAIATSRPPNGSLRKAEIQWYEANGFGRKEFKRKSYLE